ncbi:patatin-like phospholipase family protein [Rickettsia bellii]|uniref:Patatin-like phospholipase family protein n=1 Tax=Rickettsia bellii str. RML Mogi TaxID=1359194 RepID=A0A0F3QIB7_RICBE|nr:patatin-like phospholipase family protein [Rickettsia bellii]KJV91154.1 patatin-like phospholipase family protein [Rickettsia bellii str. RML Mogi]
MNNKEQNITSNIETEIVKSNRILSLSGGGVKGIAELVVLAEIEERTGKSITELFPIITGTSVRGLIAGLLTIPKESGSSIPKYTAKEVLEIFKEAAPQIFPDELLSGVKQVFTHKYSQKPLEKILDDHLGGMRLSEATSRLMIPVTNLNTDEREVEVFDSHNLFGTSGHSDPSLKDVLLATTAAPTYFKAVTNASAIAGTSIPQEALYAYADGGLAANRPAYEALKILKGNNSREQQKEILDKTMVCSLDFDDALNFHEAIPVSDKPTSNGIGKYIKYASPALLIYDGISKLFESTNDDGAIGWMSKGKLIDRLMHASEENVNSAVRSDLPGTDEFYEVKLSITKETSSLDNAKAQNIAALEEVGRQYIKEHALQLQKLCDNLLHNYNQEQNMQGDAVTSFALDDRLVADHNIDKVIISEELAQKLGANLNAQQVAAIETALSYLSPQESEMVAAFLQSLDNDQVIALSKSLPVIADGEFQDTQLGEFSTFQNKFLQVFSNMFNTQDEFGSEVSLNATQEYTTEVACDGRGSELSHHIDIGVEA